MYGFIFYKNFGGNRACLPVYFCSHWLVVKIDAASATAEEKN